MGKHSTPCKYVHHWCCLCNSPGQARFAVLPGTGPGHCWLPGGIVQQQGGEAPMAAWGWVRSRPAGWSSGTPPSPSSPLLARADHGEQVSCRGALKCQRGVGVGRKGVFLHLNTTAGHSLRQYLCQLQGKLPSHPTDGGPWPCQ